MANRMDELMRSFDSEFFQDMGDGEALVETVPANQVRSSVAENRQILNLILLIDVSGSMRGQRIAMVNNALENIIRELRRKDDLNAVIKLSVMEFSEEARWLTPQPIPVQDFVFRPLKAEPWLTNYAPAFDALNGKLSRKAFMDPNLGEYFAPLILFITDGEPSDVVDFPNALLRLSQNGWFRKSAKYAIAVGEDARTAEVVRLLSLFAQTEQNVRYADEGDALCSLIEFVAVRASEVQTSMVSSPAQESGGNNFSSIFADKDPSLFSSLFHT